MFATPAGAEAEAKSKFRAGATEKGRRRPSSCMSCRRLALSPFGRKAPLLLALLLLLVLLC